VSVVAIDGRIVHPERRLRCTVTGSFAAGRAARIVTLRIDTGGPFNFEAGQCVVLTMPDMSEQALGVASRPIDPFIELHLDPTAGNCPVRATVAVRGPYGDAYLHDEHVGPMLAIARGTGLAPIVSIVASALAIGMRQRIHLYIAAAPGADHYYLDRLGELAARHANLIVKTVPTVTANEADGATDLVEAVGRDFASLAAYRVYVAAPVGERTRLQELAIERGMLPEHWAACSPEPSTG
jgi:CDP-4-dehydro-6-deoxyglucose reductase/ferredoxin-NAD(P)+ reductase (naphthalene dioxygenase ferredoxin-specific)